MSNDLPSTGHPTVDTITQMFRQVHGAYVPYAFIKGLTNSRGEPDFSAALVLSEICLWYRATTDMKGKPIKRFKADIVQLSRGHFAKRFDLTEQAVGDVLQRLVKRKLIRRIVRVDIKYGTQQFIEILPKNVYKLLEEHGGVVAGYQPPSYPATTPPSSRIPAGVVAGYAHTEDTTEKQTEETDRRTRAARGQPVGRYPSDEQGAAPPAPPAGRPAVGGLGQQIRSKILASGQTGAGAKTSPASRQEEGRSKSLSGSNGEASQPKASGKLKHLSGDESSGRDAESEQQTRRDAAPQGAESDTFIAAELAKVQRLAPKLHQKFFRTPLPSYDPERVAEVLKTHRGKKPALKFIVRLRLAWERVGEVSTKGYKYGRCQRTQHLDHFCKHFIKLWGDVEDLIDEYQLVDLAEAYNWLNELYPELEEELEALWGN